MKPTPLCVRKREEAVQEFNVKYVNSFDSYLSFTFKKDFDQNQFLKKRILPNLHEIFER